MSKPIRVAISGGGVAGATVIHALLQYPNIDTHIFESAPQFREAGIAFGITRNAQKALELIGPSALKCLDQAGGVKMHGVRFHIGQGPDKGSVVYVADSTEGKPTTTIVQRSNFLHEMLADVPQERMHASKKLSSVDKQKDGSLLLKFEDGTTHETDVLIGADGIHSTIRKMILGAKDPAAQPRNTGWWALMTLQPFEKAQNSIGKATVNILEPRENSYIGNNVFLLHNILSHGQIVQFSVCAKESDLSTVADKWMKTVTAEEVKKTFTHPDQPEHLNKAVIDLLCEQAEQPAIFFWEHLRARTYVDGPIAIVGDAAHSTTPWQGSGGGMSIEDSMIISTLLGHAKTPAEAQVALQVYDQVRRPRTQRLVESSNETGKIVTGQAESGLDASKVKKAMAPRWDFILDFDNEKHRDEALQLMQKELQA